ncbi:hypothetical protein JAAARDRAFT_209367 [Jaapia argillacea MUCL 33604]|uniref:REJ domain-containing protein n=1 Tax=Jaapia argillacea MUCL 33604 TaxID=933084 RepID=A0A067PWI5_9AGAM|nr:hypothetical protein JAAARDRAFT_209367 [Jaapia argillacea MUCL 33604]
MKMMIIVAFSIFFCPFCAVSAQISRSPLVSSSIGAPISTSPSGLPIPPQTSTAVSAISTVVTHCPYASSCGEPSSSSLPIPPSSSITTPSPPSSPNSPPTSPSITAAPPTPPSPNTVPSTPSSAVPTTSSNATTTRDSSVIPSNRPPTSTAAPTPSGGTFVLGVPTWHTFIWVGIGLVIFKGII